MTLTLIKLPPSQSGASSGKRMVPTDSQICSATSLFLNCSYMLKTCTQKATLVRSDACKAASLSYRVRTNKCLSKLHVSAAIIRSTSALLSKEKRTTWSSICFTLNPNFVLQRGVKVLAMASMLRGRLVRNLAVIACSEVACSFFKHRPGPSLSERDKDFQCLVRSSILEKRKRKSTLSVSQKPQMKLPTSFAITLLEQGIKDSFLGRDISATT